MHYNKNLGMIYDTIYYGLLHFNEKTITRSNEEDYPNMDIREELKYYNEIKNECGSLPDYLYPFFFFGDTAPSLLSTILVNHINFHTGTIDDYIDILQTDYLLKKAIYDVLFKDATDEDKNKMLENDQSTLFKCVNGENWNPELKASILHTINFFDYVRYKLIDTFTNIYKHIEQLHKNNRHIINSYIDELSKSENLTLLKKEYDYFKVDIAGHIFSLSFLNQFIINVKSDRAVDSVFLLGLQFQVALKYIHVDNRAALLSALHIWGNESNYKILEAFQKHKQLSVDDISYITGLPSSTAARIIRDLTKEKFLNVANKQQRKYYYCINAKYIKYINKEMNSFIEKLNLN